MPPKIVHVSLLKRYDKHGSFVGPGGVERFGYYLQMAIPELEIYSMQDTPRSLYEGTDKHWEWAERLNGALFNEGLIDRNTIVVSDGFWVNGLQGRVARLISVCHGSYSGTAMEHEKDPFGEPHTLEWGMIQEEMWRDDRVEVVAVSKRSAFELKWLSDIKVDATIEHGLPLEIYKPNGRVNKRLILHTATSERKGKEIIAKLSDRFEIQQVGFAPSGKLEDEAALWQRGGIFLAPTHYEGAAYSLLEAMACGLVPVTYATGQACDLPCETAEVTDNYHETRFALMLETVLEYYSQYWPRQWVMEYADFETFAKRWRAYLND